MRRRGFLATAAGLSGIGAGCIGERESDPEPVLHLLQLRNDRRDQAYEFSVQIVRDDGVAFVETTELGPAGSGTETTVFERPVPEPGAYDVSVEVADYDADTNTASLASGDEHCLRLQFYLGASTLHWEHQAYTECE